MSSFEFKQFTIHQDRTAMKVGTDGVLLGAWASLRGDEQRILDIGTGTGLIAIMMAQRSAAAEIIGVEIDPSSAEQAAENMGESKWSERLSVVHSPIQSYADIRQFDLILTNPPYFVNSLLSKGESRTVARHTTELSFCDLIDAVVVLLSGGGHFAIILPPRETEMFEREVNGRLHLHRRCMVKGKVGGEVKRVMSEYGLYAVESVATSEIAIRDTSPNEYSSEYRDLTSEYYLKF